MKEIYTSNHMWKLFENFLVDICRVSEHQATSRHQAELWACFKNLPGLSSFWCFAGLQQHEWPQACRHHPGALRDRDGDEHRDDLLQLTFLWSKHQPAGLWPPRINHVPELWTSLEFLLTQLWTSVSLLMQQGHVSSDTTLNYLQCFMWKGDFWFYEWRGVSWLVLDPHSQYLHVNNY